MEPNLYPKGLKGVAIVINNQGYIKDSKTDPEVTFLFAGDLCPIYRLDSMLSQGNIEEAFGNTLDLFRRADVNAVNLEAPLCSDENPIDKLGPNFKSDPAVGKALANVPVHVACLSNNHIMDQGTSGLCQTLDELDKAGIEYVGAHRTEPDSGGVLEMNINGVSTAIINYGTAEGAVPRQGPGPARLDPIKVRRAVEEAAARCDIVIPIIHTGKEQVLFPAPGLMVLCRDLVESGAAAVICHHPHVPQGIEMYQDRPIAYSLGNFLFDWNSPEPETDSSFLLEIGFTGNHTERVRIHPFIKTRSAGAGLLEGEKKELFIELINEISKPLTDAAEHLKLWEEQCRCYADPFYIKRLQRGAFFGEDDPKNQLRAALTFLNLLEREEHGEILRDGLMLRVTGRDKRDKETQSRLEDLMKRLKETALQ